MATVGKRTWKVVLHQHYRPGDDVAAPRVGDVLMLTHGPSLIAVRVTEALPPEEAGTEGTLMCESAHPDTAAAS